MGATTLLILDVQNALTDLLSTTTPYLQRVATTLAGARMSNIKVIHVVTAFRPDYPEIHPRNRSTTPAVKLGRFIEGTSDVEMHAAVKPLPEEVVITKRRVSAFTGTELDMILRCYGTDRLVIAGIATSGAVLSTVRQAQDLDFQITVFHDLCIDGDAEVHRFLIDKVLSSKCKILTGQEWVDEFSARASA